jgi:small-conductance mechanosensitive channel
MPSTSSWWLVSFCTKVARHFAATAMTDQASCVGKWLVIIMHSRFEGKTERAKAEELPER